MEQHSREIQLAWLAGIFDGEGCITIGAGKYPNTIMLRIVLRSRDKFVIDEIQRIAGGRVTYRAVQKSWRPNCSDQWEWCLGKRALIEGLLVELIPYLLLKKARATEALEKIQYLNSRKNKVQ